MKEQSEQVEVRRKIIWSSLTDTGLEHLYLLCDKNEVFADGIVLGVKEDIPYRIRYQVRCDSNWRVRKVVVKSLDENEQTIDLTSDAAGNWANESGKLISAFAGCLDVDISVTPFTNTLPIRRLNLRRGESSELKVVYVAVPEMQSSVEPQRYTFVERNEAESKYKFESLDGDFTAIISVDKDGLVEDYPNLFKRVWEVNFYDD
jgi:uncharacterized protein